MRSTIAAIVALVVLWAVWAFVTWDVTWLADPGSWKEADRFFLLVAAAAVAGLAHLVASE